MDRETTEKQAHALYKFMGERNVRYSRPLQGMPNHELVAALYDAIEEGHFSLTAVLRQPEPLRTSIKEYLHAEKAQGYSEYGIAPRAMVTLRNIGSESLEIVTAAKTFRIANEANLRVEPPNTFTKETKAKLEPGKEMTMPVTTASSLLMKFSDRPYGDVWIETHGYHPQKRLLEEVRGQLVRYNDDGTEEILHWGDPEPKAKARRAEGAEA